MPYDSIQHAIDDDRARTLFTLDRVNFMTHLLAVAVLASLYWANTPDPRLFAVWMAFYAVAMCAAASFWLWHGHAPARLSPRGWIAVHAIGSAMLAGASGLSVGFALGAPGAGFPLVHTVLLSVIAMVLLMSTGFDMLNFFSAVPWVLLPTMGLYLHIPGAGWGTLGLVCAVVGILVGIYAWGYRAIYLRVMKARGDQQHMATLLAQQMQIVDQVSAARSQTISTACRDLREPLHAVGVLAASLNGASATPALRAHVAQHIAQRVETLNHLFDQLMDLAQIESARTPVVRVHFRASELFDHLDCAWRPLAAAKGLALRIAPTNAVTYHDPLLLERILDHLASNAIRYTDAGGVWIGFRRAGQREGGYIEVRDSGVGFSPGEQARIRSGLNRDANAEGDALLHRELGLATVRRLVGLMGGELKMRSASGRGTTFRIWVRMGDASLATHCAASARHAVVARATSAGRRILLAGEGAFIPDDCASRLGWVLQRVENAREALRAIEHDAPFDAVLCEYASTIEHADTRNLHAIRDALMQRSGCPAAVVVVMNDVALPEAVAAGLKGFPILHKPVSPVRLLRTLAALQVKNH